MNDVTVRENKEDTPAPRSETGALLNLIERASSDPAVDVVKLQALLDMQERVIANDAKARFNSAMHAAQMEMPRVRRDGTIDLGTKGSIPFSSYEEVDRVLRPILKKHELSVSYRVEPRDGGQLVVAEVMHSAGHMREYPFPTIPDAGPGRNALQAIVSGSQYGKRNALMNAFNIVREGVDDDGKTAEAFITDEQKEELIGLMEKSGADTRKFLDYMGVKVLDDLPASRFVQAKNALATRAAKAKPVQ